MRRLLILCATICCGCAEGPTCEEAVERYYGAGCEYPGGVSVSKWVERCEARRFNVPDLCKTALESWLTCMYESTGEDCDACIRRGDALFGCQ